MIFLIDDKKERQINFGWTSDLFHVFADVITPVYNNIELQKMKDRIFLSGNIILFHESFFDVPENRLAKDGPKIRTQILESATMKNQQVVLFSGSIGSRKIEGNTALLPVEILYQNLNHFCKEYRVSKFISISELAFGKDSLLEEILIRKYEIWNMLYDTKDTELVNLTPKLNLLLDELEKLKQTSILKDSVTNGFLKYQLKKL